MTPPLRFVAVVAALTLCACVDSAGGAGNETEAGSSGTSGGTTEPTTVGGTAGTGSSSETSSGPSETSSSSEGSAETGSTTGEAERSACDRLDAFVVELDGEAPAEASASVDAFVRAMQYEAHGLPLRCDDRVVFVATESGSVAGDFNDWDPEALVMEQPVADAPLWLAEAEIEAPGGLYKFVRNAEFVADPNARRHGWDEFGEYSQVDADPARSHHERWPGFSDAVEPLEPRTVRVFVPAAANGGRELPVLYMHDGQNVFSPDAFFGGWQASTTADALITGGTIRPVLIVAIDNTPARLEEYSHVQDDLGDGPIGGLADDYADFVVEGIMPFVESRYAVQTGPASTAVLGSSMGGLVSLHLGHRHPDVFGYVGSMSGTLAWGTFGLENETMTDRYASGAPAGSVLYVDSGGTGPCPGGGSDNYCDNVVFANVLRGQGWVDEDDLYYRWVEFAPHNEAAWAQRLPAALTDWFPGA